MNHTTSSPTSVPDSLLLKQALRYAKHGWPVLPLVPGEKRPMCSNGYKDATDDPARIRQWWTDEPRANVGIVTGSKSGLVVLDVDPENGGEESFQELEDEYGQLPETLKVQTGSGGHHFYFKISSQISIPKRNGLRPGLDLCSDGGYVVAPPSVHPCGTRYEWDNPQEKLDANHVHPLPDWLAELAQGRRTSPPAEGLDRVDVDSIPKGERNDSLFRLGCSLLNQGFSDEAILGHLLEVNRTLCDVPLDEDEVQEISKSVSTYRDQNAKGESSTSSRHQGTALDLSDPKPWPTTVKGEELLQDISAAFRRHLVLPEGAADALALWTVHTHAHGAALISPVLAITSPVQGCGKTTLLRVLKALTPRPLFASNISTAALFRSVEKYQPTLLVDEADSFLVGSDDLRGILNSGHARDGARVIRSVGDDHEPRAFNTWAPKAIAMIGKLAGRWSTLADRSIEIRMQRMNKDEEVERLTLAAIEVLEPLRRQAWRFAQRNLDALASAEPSLPSEFRGRIADNWRPLFAIAELAGGEWPARAARSARCLQDTEDSDARSHRIQVLSDIHGIFADEDIEQISSRDLVRELNHMENRPWPEWGRRDQGLSPTSLANLLKPFGVSPKKYRIGSRTYRGYHRSDLKDPFRRYLPTTKAEQSEQSPSDAGESPLQGRNKTAIVPPTNKGQMPQPSADVPGVPPRESEGAATADPADRQRDTNTALQTLD